MVLYFVGLGLADEKDVTFKCVATQPRDLMRNAGHTVRHAPSLTRPSRGLEAIRRSSRVYLEAYTSMLLVDTQRLVCSMQATRAHVCNPLQEAFYERPVVIADREMVESVCCYLKRTVALLFCLATGIRYKEEAPPRKPPTTQEADTILAGADTEDVSFLVVGDPFGCVATEHLPAV